MIRRVAFAVVVLLGIVLLCGVAEAEQRTARNRRARLFQPSPPTLTGTETWIWSANSGARGKTTPTVGTTTPTFWRIGRRARGDPPPLHPRSSNPLSTVPLA